jgi:hypothetical protein
MHSRMYGMHALQESVRQMRGAAPAQIPGARISVCHDVGGMFAASDTIIMSNEAPWAAVYKRHSEVSYSHVKRRPSFLHQAFPRCYLWVHRSAGRSSSS